MCVLVSTHHGKTITTRTVVTLSCSRLLFFFFFFSSRRRHTRLVNDWSSEVCSSDLGSSPGAIPRPLSLTVSLRRVGPEAELTVSDSGRGMAPGLLPRVFDRFRQGESGTMRSHGEIGRASCRERG